jgi:hypothetical protein
MEFMYDKELVLEILSHVIEATVTVEERCAFASSQDDFIDTPQGQEKG